MTRCQLCQRETPTIRVELAQNIGLLLARQSKVLAGELCRPCGMRAFKQMTLTTLLMGWWGLISFFVAPVYLVRNLLAWRSLRALPPPMSPEPPRSHGIG
jgi:hypothetical protein